MLQGSLGKMGVQFLPSIVQKVKLQGGYINAEVLNNYCSHLLKELSNF